MKKLIIAISVLFLSLTVAQAQPYKAAVGLEGGFGGVGLTYKHFTGASNFFDYKANFTINSGVTSIMLSDTFDWNLPLTNGLSFYYGLGVGLGTSISSSDVAFLGAVFGNLGLEYVFSAIPFAVSVDWNPGYYMGFNKNAFLGGFGWNHYNLNLGIKYTL